MIPGPTTPAPHLQEAREVVVVEVDHAAALALRVREVTQHVAEVQQAL
jgi:hypothetical protein